MSLFELNPAIDEYRVVETDCVRVKSVSKLETDWINVIGVKRLDVLCNNDESALRFNANRIASFELNPVIVEYSVVETDCVRVKGVNNELVLCKRVKAILDESAALKDVT